MVTAAVVLLQPVVEFVKVNVAFPAAIPVTKPAFVTDAIEILLLDQVPLVMGESVILLPTHTSPPKQILPVWGSPTTAAVFTGSADPQLLVAVSV